MQFFVAPGNRAYEVVKASHIISWIYKFCTHQYKFVAYDEYAIETSSTYSDCGKQIEIHADVKQTNLLYGRSI